MTEGSASADRARDDAQPMSVPTDAQAVVLTGFDATVEVQSAQQARDAARSGEVGKAVLVRG